MPNTSPVPRLFDRQAAGAFLLYLALSLLIFGRAVIAHPATVYVGRGPDPQLYIWFMAWWAHAISHGVNPFLTSVIWAPSGVHLAWTANMPLAAAGISGYARLRADRLVQSALSVVAGARRMERVRAVPLCLRRMAAGDARRIAFRILPVCFEPHARKYRPHPDVPNTGWRIRDAPTVLRRTERARLRRGAGDSHRRAIPVVRRNCRQRDAVRRDRVFGGGARDGAARAPSLVRDRGARRGRVRRRGGYRLTRISITCSPSRLRRAKFFTLAFRDRPREPGHPTTVNQPGGRSSLRRSRIRSAPSWLRPARTSDYRCWRSRFCSRASAGTPNGRFLIHLLVVICILAMGPRLEITGRIVMGFPGSALAHLPLIDKALPAALHALRHLL